MKHEKLFYSLQINMFQIFKFDQARYIFLL